MAENRGRQYSWATHYHGSDQRMTSLFEHYPDRPRSAPCQSAFIILCNAHDTTTSFLDIFNSVRATRGARGAPTDEEQDLLRACLVFAGAALDSMAKQLVRDALPTVIDGVPGAQAMLKQHVERHILRGLPATGIELLAEVLVDPQPRHLLIAKLVEDLTSGSLQSGEEVMRIGSYFDIPSSKLVSDPPLLQKIFNARNQIVHEMDVDFSQVNRNRRSRSRTTIIQFTNELFRVAEALLGEVDSRALSG